LRPAASTQTLDQIEAYLDRLLPEEARELYQWHDGCVPSLAPDLGFSSVEIAYQKILPVRGFGSLKITNAPGHIDLVTVFPVFDMDRVVFVVETASGQRPATSPLYILDLENGQLTLLSYTIRDFIDHLIEEFEAGHVRHTRHGVQWTREPFSLDPRATPYGNP
jgi:hypothetical protein